MSRRHLGHERAEPSNNRKYVIKRGNRWHVRVWMPHPVCTIWLGSYTSEREGWQVMMGWLKAGGCAYRGLPAGVLPKWVVRVGEGYRACICLSRLNVPVWRSEVIYSDPAEAHLAALARWRFVGWNCKRKSASPYRLMVS
jgi:hypothetical protein